MAIQCLVICVAIILGHACLGCYVNISTHNSGNVDWKEKPTDISDYYTSVIGVYPSIPFVWYFEIKSCADAGILLTSNQDLTSPFLEITIGSYGNSKISVQTGPSERTTYDTGPLLSCNSFSRFWLHWTLQGEISLGSGDTVGVNRHFSTVYSFTVFNGIGVMSSWGNNGEWRYGTLFMHPWSCFNGGQCYIFSGYATCNCTDRYTGTNCQTYVSPCNDVQCLNGGSCYDDSGTPVCICTTQYTGLQCETYINPCNISICHNGGTCEDADGDAVCNCLSQFSGRYCEQYVSPCNDAQCLNGGSCYDDSGPPVCICTTQYTGLQCETYISSCNTSVCHNGGACVDVNGTAVCSCLSRFSGRYCEQYIDPCSYWECYNGGKCRDINGNATCSCPRSYKGPSCEIYVNPCNESVCYNGGTCDDVNGTAVCKCQHRFTGTVCESYIHPCSLSPCTNGGQCYDIDGNPTCRCNGKHQGVHCESPVTEIESLAYKVDITTLSSFKRKRTSASDTRKSAMYLGVSGITLICIVVLFIVSLDCLPNPRKK